MPFPFKRRSPPPSGWTAACLQPGRVDVARVRAGVGKPVVELLQSFERGRDDAAALGRCGLAGRRCTTLLLAGRYQFLQVEAPDVPPEEVREILRWQIKDQVDFPVDQATLDLVDVPSAPSGAGRRLAYLAIARNDGVAALIRDFHAAGADLAAIDLPEMAQRNLARLCESGERGLALLSFDDSGGLLTFTAGGELYLARRIEVDLGQLLEAEGERRDTLFDRIGLELQRSLDNFDRQFSYVPATRLILAPNPVAPALRQFLADYLGMAVEVLDLGAVLDISAIPGLDDPLRQARSLPALGAALRDDGGARP